MTKSKQQALILRSGLLAASRRMRKVALVAILRDAASRLLRMRGPKILAPA
jgi:hypothetical protein